MIDQLKNQFQLLHRQMVLYVHVSEKIFNRLQILITFFILLASANGYISTSSNHKSVLPHYDPINDPHLRDYFERKFSLSSAVSLNFLSLFGRLYSIKN
jgi:hypothetical protein